MKWELIEESGQIIGVKKHKWFGYSIVYSPNVSECFTHDELMVVWRDLDAMDKAHVISDKKKGVLDKIKTKLKE